jgi:hypothetical protein
VTAATLRLPAARADAREHALFRQYPLRGRVRLSLGEAPTPYHVYDGHGVFVGGSADLRAARSLLATEQVQPVSTRNGRALMGVWVFDFGDASLGPHHELQLSLFVSRAPVAPLPSHRWALLQAMLTRPEVLMLCHGLWNSTPLAVAYNRERLALGARLSDSRIERRPDGALVFEVNDRLRGRALVEGELQRAHRPCPAASLALALRVGVRPLLAAARQPWLHVPVLNPVGLRMTRNAQADSFTKVGSAVARRFDPSRDSLHIHHETYGALDFRPYFFQTMQGFKFVYLDPRAD